MDLTPYVESLRRELTAAAEVAGPEARVAADRLASALDSAARLTLMDVLSDVADELTRELEPGVVEVRLRAREPVFVVTPPPGADYESFPPRPPTPPAPPGPPEPPGLAGDDTARMTLRLPESLKARIEQAAGGSGVSVNAWLVRALGEALSGQRSQEREPRIGQRISGWVR